MSTHFLMQRILILQPAFLGDVILATALVEKLSVAYPQAEIDMLVRKGNEKVLLDHPKITKLHLFDRKRKWKSLWRLTSDIRARKYDLVVNVQRHFSSGLLTWLSGAKQKLGFRQNPFSWAFSKKVEHRWELHEVQRNQALIAHLTDEQAALPKLYPKAAARSFIEKLYPQPYITISPASVWATKQLPLERWVAMLNKLPAQQRVYLLGGPNDAALCEELKSMTIHPSVLVLAGKHSFLEDAVLMQGATMNYVLDSAPLHICSAMNAPTTAIFCSTAPQFGFGPLAEGAIILETKLDLDCRPCGKHGHKECPKGHFRCGEIAVPSSK